MQVYRELCKPYGRCGMRSYKCEGCLSVGGGDANVGGGRASVGGGCKVVLHKCREVVQVWE